MPDRLRWGILSTGNIARQFAQGVHGSHECTALAVASRTDPAARAFATAQNVPRAYGSYEQLLADADVQAIYNALPNAMHHEWTIRALRAGKHVLCEKPLAANAAQAQEMFDVARQTGRLLVEAFMYRSHPLTHAVMQKLRGGAIGKVKLVRASFCFRTSQPATNIRFRADLAGGSLMDVGCYCVNFARLVAGAEPVAVNAVAHLHETGVDDFAGGTLLFPGGVVAIFTSGMTVQADNTASICGEEGYIEIPVPWKPPVERAQFTLARATPPKMDQPVAPAVPGGPPRETFHVDAGKPLYALEADDFAAALRGDKPPAVSAADTLGNMRILDQMRRQVGLHY